MTKIAVVIIDMQQAYFNDPTLSSVQDDLISHCNELISATKKYDLPLFNIRTEHAPDGSTWTLNMKQDGKDFLLQGSDEVKTVDALDASGAIELVKTRDSAFFETRLRAQLKQLEVDEIILCGVSTQSCIAQTAADAYAANIKVVLAINAIASHDPKYHDPLLALLKKEYRQRVMGNDEVIELMRSRTSTHRK